MKKRRTARAKRVMADSDSQRRFFSAASFMALIASMLCIAMARGICALLVHHRPTKPGKLATKARAIATIPQRAKIHDGFFFGSGSGREASQVLVESGSVSVSVSESVSVSGSESESESRS